MSDLSGTPRESQDEAVYEKNQVMGGLELLAPPWCLGREEGPGVER